MSSSTSLRAVAFTILKRASVSAASPRINRLGSSAICRWLHSDSGLILDAMPADASILGFANRWQGAALPHAVARTLPSGAVIRALSPPHLLATKLEAFKGRGCGNFWAAAIWRHHRAR